jgi:hypothetical protein
MPIHLRPALLTVGALVAIAFQASADDQFPKSPTKKPPPNLTVRIMGIGVLDTCKSAMTAHNSNPGLATDSEYYGYTSKRDELVAKDPTITAFDASLANSHDVTPSKMFPACNKYFADYASGVNAAALPLSDVCDKNAKAFLKQTVDGLADYRAHKFSIVSARRALETARFTMLKSGGGPMGHCALNDKFKTAFAPLKAQLDSLETQILAEETAKGIKFVPVDNKDLGVGVTYVDLKTNQPVSGQ